MKLKSIDSAGAAAGCLWAAVALFILGAAAVLFAFAWRVAS